MCNGIIGKKKGMTGYFSPEGRQIPVTVLEVGPCFVTQIKTTATDGYNALQLGFGEKKLKKVSRPIQGHIRKSGLDTCAVLKEVRIESPEEYALGQKIDAGIFSIGDKVDVTGRIKGRGFSGVIKRHGFAGGRKTHGSKCHRIPGSVGCSAWPARVMKGKKLPGQYGNTRKTIRNLEIVDIRPDENLIIVKGAVPGCTSGLVMVNKSRFAKKIQ